MHPYSPEDDALVEAATEVIVKNFLLNRHHSGAALRAASGRIYIGINVAGGRIPLCAEAIALGAASTAGEREIDTIVAVTAKDARPRIIAPCGTCRELLRSYGGRIGVIVAPGEKVSAEELLPWPLIAAPPTISSV